MALFKEFPRKQLRKPQSPISQIYSADTTSLVCAYETALNVRKCLETSSKVNYALIVA